MKKYVLLCLALCAAPALYAATEELTFSTVLSKPVGSFWNVETQSCAYPDISLSDTDLGGTAQPIPPAGVPDFSKQIVVNFGPTKKADSKYYGGTIHLNGGPMLIDQLLMEDDTTLQSNAVWMFKKPVPGDPSTNNDGILSIYPSGKITVDHLLINTLLVPALDVRDNPSATTTPYTTTITVIDELSLQNATLKVKKFKPVSLGSLQVTNGDTGSNLQFKNIFLTTAESSAGLDSNNATYKVLAAQ